jgi:hypothetical protein
MAERTIEIFIKDLNQLVAEHAVKFVFGNKCLMVQHAEEPPRYELERKEQHLHLVPRKEWRSFLLDWTTPDGVDAITARLEEFVKPMRGYSDVPVWLTKKFIVEFCLTIGPSRFDDLEEEED